jgi:hypothetical protein
MKRSWLWIVIVVNLVVLVGLVFVYPHLMVSPGPLISEHAALATDCFACHTPLQGAKAERCITCHALPDIGVRTTKGAATAATHATRTSPLKMSFHQELSEQNCMACHSDHAGPKLTRRSSKKFSHALLWVQTRDRCASCHSAPSNAMHRELSVGCVQCHKTEAWKPATFDHEKYFVLDRDHNVSCATCHTVSTNYRTYTCYGCHEHTPANVRREHEEEGIQNLDNCVKCHRSADGEREGGGDGERGERD